MATTRRRVLDLDKIANLDTPADTLDVLVGQLDGMTSTGAQIDERTTFSRNTITIDGDSIALQNNTALNGSSRGFLEWGNIFLDQRFELLDNFGVGGERTDNILARISATLATESKYIHYVMGKNDIEQSVPFSTIVTNLHTIYTRTIATGKIVIASTIIPAVTNSVAQQELINKVNNWITSRASEFDNYIVVDYYSAIVDVTTGFAKTNHTRDGIHPSVVGAFEMGLKFQEALEGIVPEVYNFTGANLANSLQLVPNSMMIGGSPTATSWDIANADSTSKEVLADGNELQVINGIDSGISTYMYQSIYDGFEVGDEVSCLINFEVTTATSIDKILANLTVRDASTVIHEQYALFIESDEPIRFPNKTFKGTLRVPNLVVPSGTVRLIPYFYVSLNGTVKVNNIQIINHSALAVV